MEVFKATDAAAVHLVLRWTRGTNSFQTLLTYVVLTLVMLCAAGCLQVFKATGAAAALAAGIFHRKEVGIDEVKLHMAENQVPTRIEA